MISAKKLIKLARRWQKVAALRRKRIALALNTDNTSSCSTPHMAEKGHFVVYSIDQKRFLLDNEINRKLFIMAEEEFGLPSKGPLTLPCEVELIEYVFALIKQQVAKDVERALLTCMASSCSLPFLLQH